MNIKLLYNIKWEFLLFIILVLFAYPHIPMLHIFVALNHFKLSINCILITQVVEQEVSKSRERILSTCWVTKKIISEAQCLGQRLTEKEGVSNSTWEGQHFTWVSGYSCSDHTLLFHPSLFKILIWSIGWSYYTTFSYVLLYFIITTA